MIKCIPSPKFLEMRRKANSMDWARVRMINGWNFARAAAQYGITVREWAMLECGVSPEDLRDGTYALHGKQSRHTAERR